MHVYRRETKDDIISNEQKAERMRGVSDQPRKTMSRDECININRVVVVESTELRRWWETRWEKRSDIANIHYIENN